MIHLTARNKDVYYRVMESAPRMGLPVLSETEIEAMEHARDRYDILVGLVDAEYLDIPQELIDTDRDTHPEWGDIVLDIDENEIDLQYVARTVINEITGFPMSKIVTFLYEELVEIAAGGYLDCYGNVMTVPVGKPALEFEDLMASPEQVADFIFEVYKEILEMIVEER